MTNNYLVTPPLDKETEPAASPRRKKKKSPIVSREGHFASHTHKSSYNFKILEREKERETDSDSDSLGVVSKASIPATRESTKPLKREKKNCAKPLRPPVDTGSSYFSNSAPFKKTMAAI